jgi:hypothetical protein
MEGMPKGGVLLVIGALVFSATPGLAESGKGRTKPASKLPPTKIQPAPAPAKESAPARSEPEPSSSASAPAVTGRGDAKSGPPPKVAAGDGGVSVIEKDGGKQFRFTETDVEGRLKVPQLVYFLRRVRAEFAAGDLGHRSFLRELSATQRERSF